jgi:vacuolar-type H+-ATPase subunit H
MDVNKLLDELEELVEHRPVPLFGGLRPFHKVFFLDVDDLLDYTHEIRASLPPQIQKADQITRDKDRILSEAHEQAERMMKEAAEQASLTMRKAQEDAQLLISNHEITHQATQEGTRIVEQARQQAEEIRQGALGYAQNMLDNLNQTIGTLSEHVAQVQQAGVKAREDLQA